MTTVGKTCPGGGLLNAHALSGCFALLSPSKGALLRSSSAYLSLNPVGSTASRNKLPEAGL